MCKIITMKKIIIAIVCVVSFASCTKKYCWQCKTIDTYTHAETFDIERCKYSETENTEYENIVNKNNTFIIGGGTYSRITRCSKVY